jgi:hypothetical protein
MDRLVPIGTILALDLPLDASVERPMSGLPEDQAGDHNADKERCAIHGERRSQQPA